MKKNSVKKTKIASAKKPQPLFYIPKAKYDWLEAYGKNTENRNVTEVINEIIEQFQTRHINYEQKVKYCNPSRGNISLGRDTLNNPIHGKEVGTASWGKILLRKIFGK